MRILIISQYWWPENGVPQRRWAWLTEMLVRGGHSVSVIAPPPHYERVSSSKEWWHSLKNLRTVKQEKGPAGEAIFRTGYLPAGSSLTSRAFNQAAVAYAMWRAVRRGPRKLRCINPTVVIGTVPALPTAIITRLVAAKFRAPYIVDLRDAWPDLLHEADNWNVATGRKSLRERLLSYGPLQIVLWLTEKLLDRAIGGADGIIVTSGHFQRELIQKFRGSLHAPPVTVIRNVFPVEVEPIEKSSRNPKAELNVLYAGTLGRAQNLGNAIRAAKYARERGVKLNLRFVGAGAAKSHLRQLADSLEVDVEIESRHPAYELEDHYLWADTALVHLNDWDSLSNAVPSKTFELMALGIHITGVVKGEAAQLIRDLGAGVVVDNSDYHALGETWIDLFENPEKLAVSGRARKWVEVERNVMAPRALKHSIEQAYSGVSDS